MAIIGISGKIFSGKDTTANIIKSTDVDSKWQIKKFAYKLKQIASIISGIPIHLFEDQSFKETYMSDVWDLYVKEDKTLFSENGAYNSQRHVKMKVRDFLQKIGTEAMRDKLHYNTWVNALMVDYKKTKNSEEEYVMPNWIITDVRFPNEYDAIKKQNGIIIRVNRDSTITNNHVSETALDNHEFDYVINNNGSISDLYNNVTNFLKQYYARIF
jgi:hypothetical protein